ncbi:trypsin-like peptidase domain-containing protein [Xanthomarina sp. F2636L]|uniref:trypsin-like peptidase domain-containing protein n=1 Tax=Xanthomarina sp. F2636L TaxID=2996018 RepID=UPI00225E04A7|nr:trypsin-like peptidase domain-containing protein [Xanthomarina sp. F2636L]MCX7550390.1 trypsin-like peptidase domain-containing protein [Xanthomarina sp. F2636L]
MKSKLLLLFPFLIFSFFLVSAQNKKPLQIADQFPLEISSTQAYFNNSKTGIVFKKSFKNKGSAYIKLHVNSFDLKAGDFVKVYSPDSQEEYIYSEQGKIVGQDKEMISEFWTGTIWSDHIVIELHSTSINNTHYGFNIDRVAYGHTPARINAAVESLDKGMNQRAICTLDNKEPIVCYDGTEMSRKAEAVCRLLIGGGGLCTGWLLGCDGSVMTNNHCIGSVSDANNTDFLFNYKYDDCAETINATSDLQATSSTFVITDSNLDFTLVTLPVNPTSTYGYLSLSSAAVAVGERIYIPQHPGGRRKEIAVTTDSGDFAVITQAGGTLGSRVEYMADTEGGSSGSPVIRYDDHLVVAIHNTGGCPNGSYGRSDQLIAAIGTNMPNCGVDDNNPSAPNVSADNNIQPIVEASDCAYQDIDLTVRIAQPASQNADVSLSVSGGTATNNIDFELLTTSLTFPAGDATDKLATLRVYNDAFVEGDEDIVISLALNANGGDAQLSALNTFNITIVDNDYSPDIGNNQTLFFDDFETDLSNWTVTGLGTTNFAIGNEAAAASTYWNANGNTTNFAFVNDDDCDCNMSAERMTYINAFDFTNAMAAYVNFDYSRSNASYDEAFIQVSTNNGVTWNNLGVALPSTTGWVNLNLDLSAYIGEPSVMISVFYNDLASWAYGLALDNFRVSSLSDALPQTAINNAVNNSLSSSGTIYSYDETTGNIMTSISNNDGFDYGCVGVAVTREGTGAQAFQSYPSPILAMDKTYNITANSNTSGDNTISFYFTEEEIAGWETAIATAGGSDTRNSLYIYRGTESVPAVVGALGNAVTLTGTFTGLEGEFLFAPDVNSIGIDEENILTFSVYPNPVQDILTIKLAEDKLPETYTIYNMLGQIIAEKGIQSTSDLSINANPLASGLYFIKLELESKSQVIRFIKE